MKAYLNLFFLLLFSSCGTLNKHAKLLNQRSVEKITLVSAQQLAKETLVIVSDSSYSQVEIELLPTGRFTYSPTKGFEGEASKVKIKQKATTLHMAQVASKLQQQSTLSLEQNKIDQLQVNEKQVKRSNVSWWPWVLLMSLLGFAWFCRKRFKSWLS